MSTVLYIELAALKRKARNARRAEKDLLKRDAMELAVIHASYARWIERLIREVEEEDEAERGYL